MTLKENLLYLLIEEGHEDLYQAIINDSANSLSNDKKTLLSKYADQVKREYEFSRPDVRNSLVEVTSSGWGNEDETTLPGKVISSSERS